MKQMTPSKTERPLLTYAISKLNPQVFSHPVWVRFWKENSTIPPDVIQELCEQAKQLQNTSLSDACQVLLLCAVYQNYSGQRPNALRMIQKAINLAEENRLPQEILWAVWGACAVCMQEGDYKQAAIHFGHLQAMLQEQNEWMLANYIEVLKQSLVQPIVRGPASEDLLDNTFHWLQQWGAPVPRFSSELEMISQYAVRHGTPRVTWVRSCFSRQRWQDYLHRLRLIVPHKLSRQPRRNGAAHAQVTLVPEVLFPEDEQVSKNEQRDVDHLTNQTSTTIPVAVHMLGAFSMTIGDLPVKLPASRGLSILKYLLLHHKQNIPRDVLMDIFWPEVDPETARNNLNVAIHSLRTALRSVIFLPLIIFQEGAYGLAPDLQVWIDVEEFDKHMKLGQRSEAQKQPTIAVTEYETAVSLYQGEFLDASPYENWTVLERERLRIAYLDTLAHLSQIYFNQEWYAPCITLCQLILTRDLCREDAHCRLMQCYSRLGQGPLALRQYQICVEALRAELDVDPSPETTRLYEQIHRHQRV